jgi:hypothetical protein
MKGGHRENERAQHLDRKGFTDLRKESPTLIPIRAGWFQRPLLFNKA